MDYASPLPSSFFTVLPSRVALGPQQLWLWRPSAPPALFRSIRAIQGATQLKESDEDSWESEFLEEFDPLESLRLGKLQRDKNARKEKPSLNSDIGRDTEADWAQRARQRAILAMEARNPSAAALLKKKVEPGQKQKTKKKKKKKKKLKDKSVTQLDKNVESFPQDKDNGKLNFQNEASDTVLNSVSVGDAGDIDDADDMCSEPATAMLFSSKNNRFGSTFSSKNDRQACERERIFNRRVIEAKDAHEVLEIVGSTEERLNLLGLASLLTPLNTATALHRIAKHMETLGMHKTDRLAFARKRYMAELVARAMEVLPGCSAQGLSNIAWALSKVGGSTLYFSEMDCIAKAASRKASELNAQNVANILGAYASMQHAASTLFGSLSVRASEIVETFNPQELAQVLWAHAELSEPADPLLNALDSICLVLGKRHNFDVSPENSSLGGVRPFGNASAEHLANISWSYAVLQQINRPSFKYFWQMLDSFDPASGDESSGMRDSLSEWHLCQLHQVNLCLCYEYPQSGSILNATLKAIAAEAWEKQKENSCSTSSHQKDVKWLLVSMAQSWVAEYIGADYSLDLALVDKKMALEFDGPSHFVRNTGLPLGHTILKSRLLESAGWKVMSIPYAEWEELDGEAKQMQFLKQLLRNAGLLI